MKNCVICEQPFESTAKTGRPKEYCSVACRRMAEREILRIEKRIDSLEEELMRLRCLSADTAMVGGRAWEVIERCEIELKNQNDRFRLLLSGAEDG
jgi:sugar-specific transcriptional regulator TrmB